MNEVLLAQRIAELEGRIAELETVESVFPRPVIATKTSAQTINHNTTTIVIYNNEVLDVGFQYNPATGVFTALRNGVYQVTASVLYDGTNTFACAEKVDLSIYVNGAIRYVLDRQDHWACGATNIYAMVAGTALACVTAGQTIDIRTVQVSGGNLPLYVADAYFARLNILRVAPYNP